MGEVKCASLSLHPSSRVIMNALVSCSVAEKKTRRCFGSINGSGMYIQDDGSALSGLDPFGSLSFIYELGYGIQKHIYVCTLAQ
jgi:hypothetical protein